ncbi:MAG: GspE/PulE family protein [Lentisphaeria bacterium]
MNTISIRKISIPDEVLRCLSPQLAHRAKSLPLTCYDEMLTVAISSEADPLEVVDALENETNYTVQCVVADDTNDLIMALKRYYPVQTQEDQNSATALFDILLNRALQLRASDIHIVPEEAGGNILMRIDGAIRFDRKLDSNILTELTAVIKIAASIDIAEKRAPLDGSITTVLNGENIDLRVATIPTIHGEHITLRLLTQDHGEELEQIDSLGMSDVHRKMFLQALSDPNGIILLSGPTGSGKTTTLYAALRRLRQSTAKHIVSIEDPVEKPVDGVTQIKVDENSERLTFNKALRSVLRHDPDIIMIGEIRDSESGDIAVKSALTGHLVLSTLHTNSAAGVLTRLVNIGIAPFLVASTLRLAIAQRLVRVPCPHCVTYRRPSSAECMEFGWDSEDDALKVPCAVGCSFCGKKGYAGRIGLYEMISIDNELRKMILKNADEREFEQYVFEQKKHPSLRADGAAKILAGKTTIEEVRNVTTDNF